MRDDLPAVKSDQARAARGGGGGRVEPRPRDGPTHPTVTAALVMIGVVAFIVAVSVLGVLGR